MTTSAISLHLSEDVRAVLSAWAEADGSTVTGKVEQIVRAAVQQARGRVERELVEARDALEATASLLPMLLRKGPNEVLIPGDLPAPGGGGILAAEILDSLGDAADLPRVQAAINDAAARYQRAAKAFAAFTALPPVATAPDGLPSGAAATAVAAAAPAPVWTQPPVVPAAVASVRAPEPFDGNWEPLLIPDTAGPALRGERLDPLVDLNGRGGVRAGEPEFRDVRKRPLRLFVKGGNGGELSQP